MPQWPQGIPEEIAQEIYEVQLADSVDEDTAYEETVNLMRLRQALDEFDFDFSDEGIVYVDFNEVPD